MVLRVQTPELPVAFGKYQLRRQIARGGMGEVYLATLSGELGFEKTLVVKTILPEHASKSRFVELFAAEAKTAVALSHGNIVPIYEFGRIDDTFYIAMGYVDGPSLSQVIKAHREIGYPIPIEAALFIIKEVLTGLAYAHSAEPNRPSLVHRDISMRNVLIERSGQVRIVDFGIAAPAKKEVDVRMGSAGYVAPEQARAETVDPRADVFSTACVLYELLTLNRAFPKPGVWMAPDTRSLPPALRPVMDGALALAPEMRPSDAGAFLAALGPVIQRYAATYGDRDLAAHMRELFPKGWSRVPLPEEGTAASVTPVTRGRRESQTFATRLMPTEAGPITAVTAPVDTGRSRRIPIALGLAALVGLGGAAAILSLGRGGTDGTESDPTAQEPAHASDRDTKGGVGDADPDAAADSGSPVQPPGPDTPPRLVGLRVKPADAKVSVDGKPVPGGSPFALVLPGGKPAEVRIERDGHLPQTLTVPPGDLEPKSVELAVDPKLDAKKEAKKKGSLTVLAPTVAWAVVKVDGRKRGQTPLYRLPLPEGRHRVQVDCVPPVCPSDRTLSRETVTIEANKERKVQAK